MEAMGGGFTWGAVLVGGDGDNCRAKATPRSKMMQYQEFDRRSD